MKALGVNCVRVFLSHGSLFMEPNALAADGLAKFDRFLALAEEAGIYVHPTGPDHWEGLPGWAKGDRVVIDFLGKKDGVAFQGGQATDYPFVLGEGMMLADFENNYIIAPFTTDLAVLPASALRQAPLSTVTEKPMARASASQLRMLLAENEMRAYEGG